MGRPEVILDPDDLKKLPNLCPDKLGPLIKRTDTGEIVKYGKTVRLAEAEAMHIVAHKTSIRCPRVKGAYTIHEVCYITMSFEHGTPLNDYWDGATEHQREHVISQLKDCVDQMRQIKGDFIGGVDYSPCKDALFQWDFGGKTSDYGPFDSHEAFKEGLVKAFRNSKPPLQAPADLNSSLYNYNWMREQLIRSFKSNEIVFTHGDLQPENIYIQDNESVSIIDWGLAGFWPVYWEFYRASFNGTWRPDFQRQLERFIPAYYMEAFVLRQLSDEIIG